MYLIVFLENYLKFVLLILDLPDEIKMVANFLKLFLQLSKPFGSSSFGQSINYQLSGKLISYLHNEIKFYFSKLTDVNDA